MIRDGQTWRTRAEVVEAFRVITSRRDASTFRRNAEATPAGVAFLESPEWAESPWAKTFLRQLMDEALAATGDWLREYHTDAEFRMSVDAAVVIMERTDAALCRELSPAERERVWREVLDGLLRDTAERVALRRRLLSAAPSVHHIGDAEFVMGDDCTFTRVPASLVAIPPAEVDPLLHPPSSAA